MRRCAPVARVRSCVHVRASSRFRKTRLRGRPTLSDCLVMLECRGLRFRALPATSEDKGCVVNSVVVTSGSLGFSSRGGWPSLAARATRAIRRRAGNAPRRRTVRGSRAPMESVRARSTAVPAGRLLAPTARSPASTPASAADRVPAAGRAPAAVRAPAVHRRRARRAARQTTVRAASATKDVVCRPWRYRTLPAPRGRIARAGSASLARAKSLLVPRAR
jgi:hypothetical protein